MGKDAWKEMGGKVSQNRWKSQIKVQRKEKGNDHDKIRKKWFRIDEVYFSNSNL